MGAHAPHDRKWLRDTYALVFDNIYKRIVEHKYLQEPDTTI